MAFLTDKMHEYQLRAHDHIEPPVMKVPVVHGTPGATEYVYCATFRTNVGETIGSTEIAVSNGPAVLNGINFIRLDVEAVPAAATRVRYFRKDGGTFKLLGEATPSVSVLDDVGQAMQSWVVPTVNTSGRPDWRAMLWKHGKVVQRPDLMDMQWMVQRGVKQLGDSIHKNGDVIFGCAEQFISGTQWRFTSGTIYLDGQHVTVPAGVVTLTGSGKELVGLKITPVVVSHTDDPYLRNLDEAVALEYATDGADRLVYTIEWVVDEPWQINIREFLDGQPLLRQLPTERTELEKQIERRSHDVSGNFVVRNFPMKMRSHATDAAKMRLEINNGKAYVEGREIETLAPQFPEIPKARDVRAVNNSVAEAFDIPGGSVLGSATEPFNVNGLAVKFRIGQGNPHTVTFSGNGQSAAQVAAQAAAGINAYPTSGVLVYCQGVNGHFHIQAVEGKDLTVLVVANDAYTVLGMTTGTYETAGQRIYKVNDDFVRTISDHAYITEVVEAVTHDGTDHIDDLGHTGVQDILGASSSAADCHDGKFTYIKNVDFVKNGNRIDFSALGGSDPANGATYYVRYRYNHNAVKGTRVRVRVTDAQMVKGVEDGKDTIVFTGNTSATEVKSGNPVTGLSGSASDVIRIVRVNNAPGQSQDQYNAYALQKNGGPLKHSASQIDWSQAGTQGSTPGGQPSTGATYYCTFEYWRHTVEGDYVCADAYLNDYEEIESAPNGSWLLRDCIDFRTVNGVRPIPAESPRFDYEYYLSRLDRIVLRSDGYFERMPGIPADYPVPPASPTGPLPIAVIHIPPYTYSPDDCIIQSMQIQRKTQQSLNEMALDIERAKYFNALYLAERSAVDNSAAADAKGIFVDPLIGQKMGDYAFNKHGVQFTAAIDPTEQCVRLPAAEDGREISVDMVNSTGLARVGKVICFAYEPWVYLSQLKATGIINVNPWEVYGWRGTLGIDPEEDYWTDVEQLPDLDTNFDEQHGALATIAAENARLARQITWGAWRLTVDANPRVATDAMVASGQITRQQGNAMMAQIRQGGTFVPGRERIGTFKSLVPERTLVDKGERVVDMTVVPFMRTTRDGQPFRIACIVKGLMPLTDIACTIDGVVVDLEPSGSTQAGTLTYQGRATVRTNGAGSATCTFVVPAGIRVGDKAIKVFGAAEPETTWAMSVFHSAGMREVRQRTLEGIVSVTERQEVTTQRTATRIEMPIGDGPDPLSETFFVSEGIVWISAVRVWFQSKDANIPVTVEVRETLNGYPSKRVIQTCTLEPADVVISDDASVATTFTFDNLVGYGPGEYCFVILTNCPSYYVWYAKTGQVDIRTGEVVRQQPAPGVMFTSPNNSFWQGNPDSDLTFEVLAANFENNAQVVFSAVSGIEANMLVAMVTQFLPESCNLHWMYSIDGGSNWVPFMIGVDTELGQIVTAVKLRCDVTASGGTFQISESGAGIICLLNDVSANYVAKNAQLAEACDKVTMIVDLAADGVNGSGTRSVTPFYSSDDGETWVELKTPAAYEPVSIGDGTYREWQFTSPGEKTITGATNATPIVITSLGHGFQNNAVIDITGVLGNTAANGTYRVANATADTFALVHPDSGAPVAGSGTYTSGGTINLTGIDQCRFRLLLETDNRAVTPKARQIRGICGNA